MDMTEEQLLASVSRELEFIKEKALNEDHWWNGWQYIERFEDAIAPYEGRIPLNIMEQFWEVTLTWRDRRSDLTLPVGAPVGISDGRQKHMHVVSEKLKAMAVSRSMQEDWINIAEQMGAVHDIGYKFTDNHTMTHEQVGGEYLRRNQRISRWWRDVEMHGVPEDERVYDSEMLDMLNYCDMTTSTKGGEMTIQQRCDDIAMRWGEGNIREINARKILEELQRKGFPIDQPFNANAGRDVVLPYTGKLYTLRGYDTLLMP